MRQRERQPCSVAPVGVHGLCQGGIQLGKAAGNQGAGGVDPSEGIVEPQPHHSRAVRERQEGYGPGRPGHGL
eukprot:2069433-Lingulodinium_polyedra.AAC.1